MFRRTVVLLDIIALLLSAGWMMYSIFRGLSASDLIFNFIYNLVVMAAFILTLLDRYRN